MKWLMCLLLTFVLWTLLFWSVEPAVLFTGAFFALPFLVYLRTLCPSPPIGDSTEFMLVFHFWLRTEMY